MRGSATTLLLLGVPGLLLATVSPTAAPVSTSKCYDARLTDGTYLCEYKQGSFMVKWSYSDTEMAFAISADTSGWVGFGFGRRMVGSYAVIGWCTTTANAGEYKLNDEDVNQVNLVGTSLRRVSCEESGGRTTIRYVRALSTSSVTIDVNSPSRVIFAWHGTDGLAGHREKDSGLAEVNWKEGTGTAKQKENEQEEVHGVCMWIAFALLIPSAIFVSRYAKVYTPTRWLMIHIGLQVLGVIFAIAGLAIALDNFEEPLESAHGKLGLTLVVFFVVQILMGGLARPGKTDPKTRCRTLWEYTHRGFGLLIVILGLVNVFLGLTVEETEEGEDGGEEEEELEHGPQIVMHTIWIVVLLVVMALLEWKCRPSASGSGIAGVSDIGDNVGQENQTAGKSDDFPQPVEMAAQVDDKLENVGSGFEPQEIGSVAAHGEQELGAV